MVLVIISVAMLAIPIYDEYTLEIWWVGVYVPDGETNKK